MATREGGLIEALVSSQAKSVALIVILIVLSYSNSLSGQFVWDDENFVVKNEAVRRISLPQIGRFFLDPGTVALGVLSREVYRPLATLSFALDFHLWRFNAFGYHCTNLLLHTVNAILVYWLSYLLFGRGLPAILSGLLFGVHPVLTEAVSWISGRSNLLGTSFFLLALIQYIRFTRDANRGAYFSSLFFFVCSLFSREVAVVFPLLIMAHDGVYSKGSCGPIKRPSRYIPYLILSVLFVLLRAHLLGRFSQCPSWGGPLISFITMSTVFVRYILLLLFPFRLCANYGIQLSMNILEPEVVVSLSALTLIFSVTVAMIRRKKDLSFFIVWFFITLLPVSNIVPIKALMADRFLYLPSVGFAFAGAMFFERALTSQRSRPGREAAALLCAALVAFYCARTYMRNTDWADTITISERTVEDAPDNPWPLTSLGVYYFSNGAPDQALEALQRSLAMSSNFSLTHSTIARVYLHLGRIKEAERHYREAIRLEPGTANLHNGLGAVLAEKGDFRHAKEEFEQALRMSPGDLNSRLNLARLCERREDDVSTLRQYWLIISEHPHDAYAISTAYYRIAELYKARGRLSEAKRYYERCIGAAGDVFQGIRDLAKGRLETLDAPSKARF